MGAKIGFSPKYGLFFPHFLKHKSVKNFSPFFPRVHWIYSKLSARALIVRLLWFFVVRDFNMKISSRSKREKHEKASIANKTRGLNWKYPNTKVAKLNCPWTWLFPLVMSSPFTHTRILIFFPLQAVKKAIFVSNLVLAFSPNAYSRKVSRSAKADRKLTRQLNICN